MRLWLSLLLGLTLLPLAAMNSVQAQEGAVYAVSYIDAAPASRAAVASALQQLAAASRKDDGNLRFEILAAQRACQPVRHRVDLEGSEGPRRPYGRRTHQGLPREDEAAAHQPDR